MHRKIQGIIKFISQSKGLKRLARMFLWLFGGLILLLLSLSLMLLIPSVQKFAVNQATNWLTAKTHMHAEVGSVRISFPKTIQIGDIYLEDQQEDTLLFCEMFSLNADILPLIVQKINIDELLLKGLKSRIYKNPGVNSYNFSPLLEAFAAEEKSKKKSTSWQIGFDELNLQDIDLSYSGNPDASSFRLLLDKLQIIDNGSDLSNQDFDLEAIELGKTSLMLRIDDKEQIPQANTKSEDDGEFPLSLKLGKFNIEETAFNLNFTSDKLALSAYVKKASMTPDLLDLSSQNISLKELLADGIDVSLQVAPQEADNNSVENKIENTDALSNNFTFGNIGWNLFTDHLEITNTQVLLDLDTLAADASGINYAHLGISQLGVVADSIYFNKNSTGASISTLSLAERSGPEITALHGVFSMNNSAISAKNMGISTTHSNARGSFEVTYPALSLIGKEIAQLGINADLEAGVHMADLNLFIMVDDNSILHKLDFVRVDRFISSGVLNDLNIKNMELTFGEGTLIKASSGISGMLTNELNIVYKIDTAITIINDIKRFVPDTLLPSDISLPPAIFLSSSGHTNLTDGAGNIDLASDLGRIYLSAKLSENQLAADLELKELDIGKTINDTIYGHINLVSHIDANMANNSIESLGADIMITSIDFNDYRYENGQLHIDWLKNQIGLKAQLMDSAFMATLNGTVIFQDSGRNISMSMDLLGSDLHALNFSDTTLTVSGSLLTDLDIKANNDFRGIIRTGNIALADEINAYTIDTIVFDADINQNYTNFNLNSEILQASLTGNTRLDELKDAFIDHLDLYIQLPDSMVNDKDFKFEFELELKDEDIFTDFLITDLKKIVLEKCYMKYDDAADELTAQIDIPVLEYKGFSFNDLAFRVDSEEDKASTSIMVRSLTYDLRQINHIELSSIFTPREANMLLEIKDLDQDIKYRVNSILSYRDSLYEVRLNPEGMVLANKIWKVSEENLLQFSNEGKFSSNTAVLSQGDQKISMSANDNLVRFSFDNFRIQNIANILEYDSTRTLIEGGIHGDIELSDPFGLLKIKSELTIPELMLDQQLLGNLRARGTFDNSQQSEFDVELRNNANHLQFVGTNSNIDEKSLYEMMIEADIDEPDAFEPLLRPYIEQLKGAFSGKLSFNNKTQKPVLNGNLNFDNLGFKLRSINTELTSKGNILIDNNRLQFESFEIRDSLNNPLSIMGTIDTRNFADPAFNLNLKTEKFQAINSKPVHHPNLYGKLNLGSEIVIKGKLSGLNINSSFTVVDGTDMVFVMPGKELELITDEGIVEFVDFDDQALEVVVENESKFIGDSLVSLIEGIDLTTNLRVDPNAQFTIIVDPNSGDYTIFDSKEGYSTSTMTTNGAGSTDWWKCRKASMNYHFTDS